MEGYICNIDMMLEQKGRHTQFKYAVWHAKFKPGPRLNDIKDMSRYSKLSLLLAYKALVEEALRVSTLFKKMYPNEEQHFEKKQCALLLSGQRHLEFEWYPKFMCMAKVWVLAAFAQATSAAMRLFGCAMRLLNVLSHPQSCPHTCAHFCSL